MTQAAGESAVFSLVSGASSQKLYKNGVLALEGNTSVGATKLSANATGKKRTASIRFTVKDGSSISYTLTQSK